MLRYCLEFILNVQAESIEALKNSIAEFGEDLEVSQLNETNDRDFKIRIYTEDPTIIFDTCSQFGKLKSVKINETG